MSSVAQRIKTVHSKHWTTVLQSANKSKTESCTFVKHLITISISNILYLRKILSDDDFDATVFEGMTLKFLKTKSCSPGAETIGKWLNGAFESVDKKFLKHLMLEVKDSDAEKTLELYVMSFEYDEGKDTVNFSIKSNSKGKSSSNKGKFSLTDIQARTIELIQMCITVTKTCSSLPESFMISMRLSYNDNAPFGYLPDGYKPCEAMSFEFAEPPRKIELGVVQTNFHSFRLITKTCLNNQNFDEIQNLDMEEMEDIQEGSPLKEIAPTNEVNLFQNDNLSPRKSLEELCLDTINKSTAPANMPIPVQDDSGSETEISVSHYDLISKAKSISINEVKDTQETVSTIPFPEEGIRPSQENKSPSAFDFLMSSQDNFPINNKDQKIKCPCESEQQTAMIFQCLECGYWSHSECYGFLELPDMGTFQFICVDCHGVRENVICHDNILLDLKASLHQKLAAFRRVLSFCNNPKVKVLTLSKVEKILGLGDIEKIFGIIIKKLLDSEMASATSRKNNYSVNKEKLQQLMPQYFYSFNEFSENTQQSSSMLFIEPPKPVKRKRSIDDEPLKKKCKTSISPYKRIDKIPAKIF